MREKTHPSGRNKSTNTTPPPPSQSTEIRRLDTEESNTTTCWGKCCSCCRKKTNKKSTLTDTDIAALMGQYEYVVEKLHIVKVPLLLCGTEEDMKERIDKLNAISKKTNKEISSPNEDWECLPFKNTFHPVYFVQEDTQPSFTEIFSRENEPNGNPDEEITSDNGSTEEVEQTPTDEAHRISKETVTSRRFAMIPPEREPSSEKKETLTVHFTVSDRENRDEMQEDIWAKPEHTVESIHSIIPQRSKRSTRESAKYDSYKHDYPESRRAHQPTTSDAREYYDEYRPSYHQRDPAPVHDTTRLSSQNTYMPALPLQSEANRPSSAKRHESNADARRLLQQGSPILRPIPAPSRTLPSTSRAPPPSTPEPHPSTSHNQSGIPPPKGPVSHLKPIVLSSSTSSEVVSILSSKPSVKSAAISKESDVLIEEGKPRTTEDTTQKKLYVDVSGKHLPKTEVHKILNKYSSIFVENLKDPIPKDPQTLPKDNKDSQTRPTPNPPMVVQSSRRPVVAEAITERSKNKMDQLPVQVTARTEPPQSSRSPRSSTARGRAASGGSVDPVDPAMYDTSPPPSAAAVKRTSGSRHRDGEPSTFRDGTEIRKSFVQQQVFQERTPRSSYKGEQSHARKKRTSKEERTAVIDDDLSVEMGCHDLTHEHDRDSGSSDEFHHSNRDPRKSCKYSPAQRHSIYRVSGQNQNDPFQVRTLPTTSALPPQEPVSVHPPCCKEQTNEEHRRHLNTGETQCPHPCPHTPDERQRICTAEHEDSASDLQNTNVIKHWKIIIKQHKDTENDSAGESDQ